MSATSMLYTTVKNGSTTSTMVFGFLGPRGMRLAPSEVVSIRGDLLANLGNQLKYGSTRQFDSLRRALAAGALQILNRPAPIVYDAAAALPRVLVVSANVVSTPAVVPATYA